MQKFPITRQGYEQIIQELRELKTVERPTIIKAIAEAREQGDLSENADYQSAKEKQGFIEGKINDLENRVSRSEVIDTSKITETKVVFGATITLADCDTDEENTYQIVGEYEADIANKKLSLTSPIARSLIGKEEGDFIEVNTPSGIKEYEILKVLYK